MRPRARVAAGPATARDYDHRNDHDDGGADDHDQDNDDHH